jgi:hypothetical protein
MKKLIAIAAAWHCPGARDLQSAPPVAVAKMCRLEALSAAGIISQQQMVWYLCYNAGEHPGPFPPSRISYPSACF